MFGTGTLDLYPCHVLQITPCICRSDTSNLSDKNRDGTALWQYTSSWHKYLCKLRYAEVHVTVILYDTVKTENLVTTDLDEARLMRLNCLPYRISPLYRVLQCIKCHQGMATTSPGTNQESARLVRCTGECSFSYINRFFLRLEQSDR